MKVALCYSGLFKSWNHLHTQFDGIRNLLAPATNEIDFDVYIHSWDYKTNLQKVNKFKNTLENFKEVNNIFETTTTYNEFDTFMEDNPVNAIYVSDKRKSSLGIEDNLIFVDAIEDQEQKLQVLRYKFAQFWSQWLCFESIKQDYDLVVKLRPDVWIGSINKKFIFEPRFYQSRTFAEFIREKNADKMKMSIPGIRSLSVPHDPIDKPMMFVDINVGDMAVTEFGNNLADWCLYMGGKDFNYFKDTFKDKDNFMTNIIDVYKEMEVAGEDHGVARILSSILTSNNFMVYCWQPFETNVTLTA